MAQGTPRGDALCAALFCTRAGSGAVCAASVAIRGDSYRSAWRPLKIASTADGSDENGNWSSFQLANSAPPLSVTGSAIAPSARMRPARVQQRQPTAVGEPCGKCGTCGTRRSPRGGIAMARRAVTGSIRAAQLSFHVAPIFRLLLKIAVY